MRELFQFIADEIGCLEKNQSVRVIKKPESISKSVGESSSDYSLHIFDPV